MHSSSEEPTMALNLKDRRSTPALARINFCENYSFLQKYMTHGVSNGRVDDLHNQYQSTNTGLPGSRAINLPTTPRFM